MEDVPEWIRHYVESHPKVFRVDQLEAVSWPAAARNGVVPEKAASGDGGPVEEEPATLRDVVKAMRDVEEMLVRISDQLANGGRRET